MIVGDGKTNKSEFVREKKVILNNRSIPILDPDLFELTKLY